jgi:hypothetical protein
LPPDDIDRTCQFDPDSTLLARAVAWNGGAPSTRHALVLCDRDGHRRRIDLGPGETVLGRAANSDIVLDDAEVSRRHCGISVAGDTATLTELGSTNGTWLDAERLRGATVLAPGTTLRIGPFLLHYQRGSAAEMGHAAEVERELDRANEYVRALLPLPITAGPVRADWRFVPSGRVGGDAFGFRWLDAERFAVFMMDVAGHGAGSALLAASVMNVLRQRAAAVASPAAAAPAAVLAELNATFQMEEQGGLFFSAWYGLFRLGARELDFASAGHHPAYLATSGAPPRPLATRNPAVGMLPGHAFRADRVAMPAGARLTLFSDGAFETIAADGAQRTLAQFLPALAAPSEPGVPEPERLLRAARGAMRPGPFDDDVSILVVEFD